MNIENLKNILISEGIRIEPVETIKNGICCTGLIILIDKNINPIVYYSEYDTVEELKERIVDVVEKELPDFDLKSLLSHSNLKSNVRLAIQRKGNENIIKRNYLDTEIIVKLHTSVRNDGERGTIKINSRLLSQLGVGEDEVFEWALKNTKKMLTLQSMNEILGFPETEGQPMFYVAGTTEQMDGAIALAYPELFQKFCYEKGVPSCLILPSSTQEILILEEHGIEDVTSLVKMVSEVNATCVNPILCMNPTVYRYTLADNMVCVAATLIEKHV